MTLILFIPYSEGWILIGDRQNTHEDGYKEEVLKLHLQSDEGPAMGCAGETVFFQRLYSKVKDESGIANDVLKKIKDLLLANLLEYNENIKYTSMVGWKLDFEMILVVAIERNIVPYAFTGIVETKIDSNRMFAIPRDNREVKQFLNYDTCDLTEEQAISLGEKILQQSAFSNSTIGPPEYHGYDLIKVTKQCKFSIANKKAKFERNNPPDVFDSIRQVVNDEEQ